MTAAHGQATLAHFREHTVMLCLQDITVLDYNGRQTTGLWPLNYEAQRGLYLHPAYAVTPQREPRGVINAWTWARQFKTGNTPRGGVVKSVRWTESYERIAGQASKLPGDASQMHRRPRVRHHGAAGDGAQDEPCSRLLGAPPAE